MNCAAVEDSSVEVLADGTETWGWCSGCGFLVILLCMVYLCALSFILYKVSTQGVCVLIQLNVKMSLMELLVSRM